MDPLSDDRVTTDEDGPDQRSIADSAPPQQGKVETPMHEGGVDHEKSVEEKRESVFCTIILFVLLEYHDSFPLQDSKREHFAFKYFLDRIPLYSPSIMRVMGNEKRLEIRDFDSPEDPKVQEVIAEWSRFFRVDLQNFTQRFKKEENVLLFTKKEVGEWKETEHSL
jgi:hypothetical protein